jgi:hypothetical protein
MARTPLLSAALTTAALLLSGCIEDREVAYIHATECGNDKCEFGENPVNCGADCPFTTKADILIVVDNSGTMTETQRKLGDATSFFTSMRSGNRNLPDLHVGVVTTDLGTGPYTSIRFCEQAGGDRGELGMVNGIDRAATCIGPGQRYIVDMEPTTCDIQRDGWGGCLSHACGQPDCDEAAQPNEALTLFTDEHGCPRCRNFDGTLFDIFACMTNLGTEGCGFEQPLEAMHAALDNNPANGGFLRDNSVLAVIFVTDEDDCSARRPEILFNPDPASNTIDSELGFLHSFRCFEFGVVCDVNGRDPGTRYDCEPRSDTEALLHPISNYSGFLTSLRDPGRIVVAAIAGPFDGLVSVALDTQNRPEVEPTCTDNIGGPAYPGVRLHSFASYFNPTLAAMNTWAYSPVCAEDYLDRLHLAGTAISTSLGFSRL